MGEISEPAFDLYLFLENRMEWNSRKSSINSRRWIESILIKPISTDFVRRKIPVKIKFVLKQNEVDLIEPIYCNNLQ